MEKRERKNIGSCEINFIWNLNEGNWKCFIGILIIEVINY